MAPYIPNQSVSSVQTATSTTTSLASPVAEYGNFALGGLSTISAFGGIANSIMQYKLQKAQGQYQKAMYEANSRMSLLLADDAIQRGDTLASRAITKSKEIAGTQRASFAAQGVDVDYGSAKDTQASTLTMGELDALQIRNNAWREAWGYKTQALQGQQAGNMAAMAANYNATNTLLTGVANAGVDLFQGGYYAAKGLQDRQLRLESEAKKQAAETKGNIYYSTPLPKNEDVAQVEWSGGIPWVWEKGHMLKHPSWPEYFASRNA